jgi:hypothetical protein
MRDAVDGMRVYGRMDEKQIDRRLPFVEQLGILFKQGPLSAVESIQLRVAIVSLGVQARIVSSGNGICSNQFSLFNGCSATDPDFCPLDSLAATQLEYQINRRKELILRPTATR